MDRVIYYTKRVTTFLIVAVACYLVMPVQAGLAGDEAMPPTIEELTGGKVKVGDLVTKDNVDLVKDYLSVAVYELVKQGMVLEMGKNVGPWEIVPDFFREATKKNHELYGDPVVDENVILYTKDGKPWPGGLAFENPSNVLEVMANQKYCAFALDDSESKAAAQWFVDSGGKRYKTAGMNVRMMYLNGRVSKEPLGSYPGYEDEFKREMPVFVDPLELKGLGQLNIRYWDDYKQEDKGFAYIPSFKRVIRISVTTWQDNMGGGDFTWGDPQGTREPFAYWNFKLIGKKNMLVPAPYGERPEVGSDLSIELKRPFDQGHRFIRDKWVVTPYHVVEATPKVKHIYSKKILYIAPPEYWQLYSSIKLTDQYDKQGKLWKALVANMYTEYRKDVPHTPGEAFPVESGTTMYDLQTRHTTHFFGFHDIAVGQKPESFTLNVLMSKGR